jgi:hypothetical protein
VDRFRAYYPCFFLKRIKPMPDYKIVSSYTSDQGDSFTETWYATKSSFDAVQNAFDSTVSSRLAMLNDDYTFRQVRFIQLDGSRLTSFLVYNSIGHNGDALGGVTGGAANQRPAPAGTAILCLISADNRKTRHLWLRGINQGDVEINASNGLWVEHPNFINSFRDYRQVLKAAGMGLRSLKSKDPLNNPIQKISKVDGSRGDGSTDVTTIGAVIMDATQRVIITRASKKDLPGLNGRFQVLKQVGNVITIPYNTPANAVIQTAALGYVHGEQYAPISVIDPLSSFSLRVVTRDTKNGLTRSRGARRAVRVRSLV